MYNYENEELLKRIAWMYYEDGLNQQEIADRLKLSRTKVLRLLRESRASGFVAIRLDVQSGLLFALEKKLCQLVGLDECFIVPAGSDPLAAVARALVYRFEAALRSCRSIGLGGGRTLNAFAKDLDPPPPGKTVTREVVSLVGNTKANLALEPYEITSILAAKLQAEVFNLWAPAKAATEQEAELIMKMPSIRTVLQKAEGVEVAFLGIGDMQNSSYVRYGYLDERKLKSIREGGAVGEILGRFYDENGIPLEKDYNKLCISVALPMRSRVIGVAGGMEKFKAILGALRTGWLNGLIVDEATATALVGALDTRAQRAEEGAPSRPRVARDRG